MSLSLTILLVLTLLWQIVLVGATFVFTGHAAREGARELAVGASEAEVAEATSRDLPRAWRRGTDVQVNGDNVEVAVRVPAVVPGVPSPWTIRSSAGTLKED